MRRFCRKVLRDLHLRPPLDAWSFCQALATDRDRPIDVIGRPVPATAASGLLITFPTKDLIVYQAETTTSHQAHIIFHEAIHLIRNHRSADGGGLCAALLDREASSADVSMYEDRHEWEAEVGATILSGWAQMIPATPRNSDADTDAVDRLTTGLGGSWEWT